MAEPRPWGPGRGWTWGRALAAGALLPVAGCLLRLALEPGEVLAGVATAGWWVSAAVLAGGVACVLMALLRGGAGPPRALPGSLVVGVALLALVAFTALLAPLLAPGDPSRILDPVALSRQPPGPRFWFGTDHLSRDVFARVVHGSRLTLAVAAAVVALAVSLGTLVGALAGYLGGLVDGFLMRAADALMAFPRLVLLLVVMALAGEAVGGMGRLQLVVVLLALTGWMATSRLVRAEVLSLREREFILAARVQGLGPLRILLGHVLPACATPVLVAAALGVGGAVLLEASLSFLGHGVPEPHPSWGAMVNEGRVRLEEAWWVAAFPGAFLALTVLGANLAADGLRILLDPRMPTPGAHGERPQA